MSDPFRMRNVDLGAVSKAERERPKLFRVDYLVQILDSHFPLSRLRDGRYGLTASETTFRAYAAMLVFSCAAANLSAWWSSSERSRRIDFNLEPAVGVSVFSTSCRLGTMAWFSVTSCVHIGPFYAKLTHVGTVKLLWTIPKK